MHQKLLSQVRNPDQSGHGKSTLIWPSEVGKEERLQLMPCQIFHVATIALTISSQTYRPTTTKWEVTCMACRWWHHFLMSPYYWKAWILNTASEAPADNTSKKYDIAISFHIATSRGRALEEDVNLCVEAEMWMRAKERHDLCLTTHFP